MKNPTRYSDREGNTIPLTKGDIRRLRKIEALFHPSAHNTYRHIPLDAFSLNHIFFYRPMVTSKMLEDPKSLPFNIGDYLPTMRTVQDFAQIPNESPIEAKVSEVAETPATETMPEMTAPAPAFEGALAMARSCLPARAWEKLSTALEVAN